MAAGGPLLPDSVLFEIFLYLDHADVLAVGLVCRQWRAVARDEFLWKELFYRYYRVSRDVPRHPGAPLGAPRAGAAGPWCARRGLGNRPAPSGRASEGPGASALPSVLERSAGGRRPCSESRRAAARVNSMVIAAGSSPSGPYGSALGSVPFSSALGGAGGTR